MIPTLAMPIVLAITVLAGRAHATPPTYQPLSATKPTLAEKVHAETVKAAVENSRAASEASWARRASAPGGKASRGLPPSIPWCADAALADIQCQLVVRPLADATLHRDRDPTWREVLNRAISSGPPTHCMAWDDPLVARADAWARYCNTGDAARKALLDFLSGRSETGARGSGAGAKEREAARLSRVAAAFEDIERQRNELQRKMEGRRLEALRECDGGAIAACRELEDTAFMPPALPDKVWIHAQAQQCRLGARERCDDAAKVLWESGDWGGSTDLREAACFMGNLEDCVVGAKKVDFLTGGMSPDKKLGEGLRLRKMLWFGCDAGHAASCGGLRWALGGGLGGCEVTPEEAATLQRQCRAGVSAACEQRLTRIRPGRRPSRPQVFDAESPQGRQALARLASIADDRQALTASCRKGGGWPCIALGQWAERHHEYEPRLESRVQLCRHHAIQCNEVAADMEGDERAPARLALAEEACLRWGELCGVRASMSVAPVEELRWREADCSTSVYACEPLYWAWREARCPAERKAARAFVTPGLMAACKARRVDDMQCGRFRMDRRE